MIRSFILILLLCGGVFNAFSQQPAPTATSSPKPGRVTGRVLDAAGKPVEYASVAALRADSSAVAGALTAEDGTFSIAPVPFGEYMLRVSGVGYATDFVEGISITADSSTRALGAVRLVEQAKSLREVTVSGAKPLVEMQFDKKTFNVEQQLTSTGGSATDVLQNVPSLSVDADGNVQLRGRGAVTLLIDGKPATLLSADAASALLSLPASSIQSVEVVTSPGARYDAQGLGGIVNIVTKKDRRIGLNGTASLGAGTRDKYNGSISLNTRKGKWNLFANSSFRLNRNRSYNLTERFSRSNDTIYRSEENSTRRHLGWFSTLGAEWSPNAANTFTLTENINVMRFGNGGTTDFRTYPLNEQLLSLQRRETDFEVQPFSISSSLGWKHKFKKPKTELTTDVTYARMWATRDYRYVTNYMDGNEALQYGPVVQEGPGEGGNSSLNAQADYTMPILSPNGKLDAGLKTQLFSFESSNTPSITQPGSASQTDLLLLNNYKYNQNVHAAYVSLSESRGKWSGQAGLRLEYATYDGETFTAGGQRFTNEFLNLFPSAFVSYKLSDAHDVYGSYTKRVNRPSFFQLMPFADIANPQDTGMGNPGLIPEFIHHGELAYNRRIKGGHNFIASAYYQYTENLIERYRRFYADGTSFTQPQNLGYGMTYGAEITGRAQISKAWDASLNVNAFQNDIRGENIDASINTSGFAWFAKGTSSLKLPANFSIQVSGVYESEKPVAQGQLEDVAWMDVAVRKSFMKGRLNAVLNVSDVFNSRKYTTRYDFGDAYQSVYRDRETRIGNLTLSYRIGGADAKQSSTRRGGGNRPGTQDRGNLRSDESGGGEGGF